MNLKNNDEKCFQYAITVVLNHEEKIIKKDPKIKLFINQHNWKEIDFPSHKRLERVWSKQWIKFC